MESGKRKERTLFRNCNSRMQKQVFGAFCWIRIDKVTLYRFLNPENTTITNNMLFSKHKQQKSLTCCNSIEIFLQLKHTGTSNQKKKSLMYSETPFLKAFKAMSGKHTWCCIIWLLGTVTHPVIQLFWWIQTWFMSLQLEPCSHISRFLALQGFYKTVRRKPVPLSLPQVQHF